MADDSLFDRVRDRIARLGSAQDTDPSPQARDERPTVVGREAFREEIDADDIERLVEEYYQNPLIRVPMQNFASDVTEPGISVVVETGDDSDPPTVEFEGEQMALDDALEAWFTSSYIDGFDFDADGTDLLEEVVKDRRGRRGTAVVEHAYDDPTERERLLALRPIKVETLTAYTREGKGIVLRPDDEPGSFDSVAVQDLGDLSREKAPTTPAGKTAAVAQFDDIFGAEDRDEIPFALDDITVSARDPDTGALFGRPDSATVINRAASLRKKLRYVDQSVLNTAFGNIIATVDTTNEEIVKKVRDNLSPNVSDRGEQLDPDTVSVTNAPADLIEVEGQVPDVVDIIQQEIEYILTAMPTPLYRVGFAGDINRDITSEQREDYRDAVKRERRRLEADFQAVLEQKARELVHDDAHAAETLSVTPQLRLRPSQSESPLRDEEFDAAAFSDLMSGLSTAAGPAGGATAILPRETIIETLLDMDPDAVLDDDTTAEELAPPDESDPAVREAFAEFRDIELANRFQAGDVVDTPDGLGVVVDAITEDAAPEELAEVANVPDEIEASSDSPTYGVVTEQSGQPVRFFKASDMELSETGSDIDPFATLEQTEAASLCEGGQETAELAFSPPESWREAETPARVIGLDAFSSMGGDFDSCEREMRGEVASPDRFCGAFLDWVYGGYDFWRGDSFLPGD